MFLKTDPGTYMINRFGKYVNIFSSRVFLEEKLRSEVQLDEKILKSFQNSWGLLTQQNQERKNIYQVM